MRFQSKNTVFRFLRRGVDEEYVILTPYSLIKLHCNLGMWLGTSAAKVHFQLF